MTPDEARQKIIQDKLDELAAKLVKHVLSPEAPNWMREVMKMNFAKGGFVGPSKRRYLVGETVSGQTIPLNRAPPPTAPGSVNITITVKNSA